jgi:hypothetical protein
MVGSVVGAMTPVIFITIGFLSCWFLLYALVEWTQDGQREPKSRVGQTRRLIATTIGVSASLILEVKKDFRRERCV